MSRQVIRAVSMGYCMGVDRAVKKAEDGLALGTLYALGSLIHNNAEINRLANLGLSVLPSNTLPPNGSRAIIRAHGIAPLQRENLISHDINLIDATCPLVVKNQKIVAEKSREGYFIIIVGKANHPEIEALIGFTASCLVINSVEEALNIKNINQPVLLIAQTTLEPELFSKIEATLRSSIVAISVPPSICPATQERQQALIKLVTQCEVVVVVGDQHSSNTKGLVNRVKGLGKKAFLVEDVNLPSELKDYQTIGLTAGASAPAWLINSIEKAILALE